MPDPPPFGVRFKDRPTGEAPSASAEKPAPEDEDEDEDEDALRHDRVPIYRRAVELAACAHAVIELAASERFFLRDQLDRSTSCSRSPSSRRRCGERGAGQRRSESQNAQW